MDESRERVSEKQWLADISGVAKQTRDSLRMRDPEDEQSYQADPPRRRHEKGYISKLDPSSSSQHAMRYPRDTSKRILFHVL